MDRTRRALRAVQSGELVRHDSQFPPTVLIGDTKNFRRGEMLIAGAKRTARQVGWGIFASAMDRHFIGALRAIGRNDHPFFCEEVLT